MKYCFGIDIGGTTIKMALFNEREEMIEKWCIKTCIENQGETILCDIVESVRLKQEKYKISSKDILGIGVGVPAAVSCEGIVESTTNLGWSYKEVKRELEEMTGFSVYVENDANLAALGEMWKGSGKKYQNVVMVTLGTGVGGGIILEGKILSGVKGGAGEIGDIYVEYEKQKNGSVIPRNLEYYASATGIRRLALNMLTNNTEKTILKKETVNAKTVFDAVRQEDSVAIKVAECFGFYLGQALTNLAFVLAPEVFIIGGGVSKAGGIVLEYVRKYYHAPNTEVMLATLGNDAGVFGAAGLILK